MHIAKLLSVSLMVLASTMAGAAPVMAATETIVLLRHGEKPPGGLGQLDCQGLNRALALPSVLIRMFGRPDAVFAPNPSEQKHDDGGDYDYVRPLATIEPTAIAAGIAITAGVGVSHVDQLQQALETPALHGAVVFVSWEHHAIVTLAHALLTAHGADGATVPDWPADAFDRLYVIHLRWSGDTAQARFEVAAEGLDGQSSLCPGMPPGR